MDNKDIKRRDVLDFDTFSKAYEQSSKLIPLKKGESAHPGAHAIQAEGLYVRNDANPYSAMGIPYNEDEANINDKMTANQVDVFHGRKLTEEEKTIVDDTFANQTVTHHQMAFILDESIAEEIKWGMFANESTYIFNKEEFEKSLIKESEKEENDDAEEELTPAEEAKAEYEGKSVTLNGDHAKLTDKDGTANIKSETNELSMSWVEAGEKMKKGGNFHVKKEEPKEEKPKEEKPKEEKTKEEKTKEEKTNEAFEDVDNSKQAAEMKLEEIIGKTFPEQVYTVPRDNKPGDYTIDSDVDGDGTKYVFANVYLEPVVFDEINTEIEDNYKAYVNNLKAMSSEEVEIYDVGTMPDENAISISIAYEYGYGGRK